MVPVYVGIGIGLLLLVLGVAVCVLALCKRKCHLIKSNLTDYGVMDNPNFDWKAEDERAGGCPSVNPRRSDGHGLSISVYPWRKEVEGLNWKDAKLSFSNPLYHYPPNHNEADSKTSDA